MFGSHSQDEFTAALRSFVHGCMRISHDHSAKNYPNVKLADFEAQWLQKRVRVVREGSAHCFVDFATGDVFKAAGWAAPAKHARGNIYDADNGLKLMGPYGPAYLR